MTTFRTIALAVGVILTSGAVGAGGYLALGGKLPGARKCPGGIVSAQIGAPFELTAHTGERAGSETLKGDPSLIYFGYATCPDICPQELAEAADAVTILDETTDLNVTPVMITIDPERDTVEKLAQYAPFFHERMLGLTGTPDEIAKTAKDFRIFYSRVADPDFVDGYSMDHSNIFYLLDKNAEYVTFFRGGDTSPEQIADGIACHLG